MQREEQFVNARRGDWEELSRLLVDRKDRRTAPAMIARRAALYRAVCADLMRARSAAYGVDLVASLDVLASRAHNRLYRAPRADLGAAFALFTRDFPAALRRSARFFALAAALFVLPGVVGFLGASQSRAFAAQVLPGGQLEAAESSYAEVNARDAGEATHMAGFYVDNNVGIAFRCFATGILFGLGSVFFLVYNGLVIGAVLGAVVAAGHTRNILTFVCGHSSLELTAIVIAGAAGLQMGYALVETHGLSRWGSLRTQSRTIATLVLGAAGMLLLAAGVEGFWSGSGAPAPMKWAASGVIAALVASYLVFVGRNAPRKRGA